MQNSTIQVTLNDGETYNVSEDFMLASSVYNDMWDVFASMEGLEDTPIPIPLDVETFTQLADLYEDLAVLSDEEYAYLTHPSKMGVYLPISEKLEPNKFTQRFKDAYEPVLDWQEDVYKNSIRIFEGPNLEKALTAADYLGVGKVLKVLAFYTAAYIEHHSVDEIVEMYGFPRKKIALMKSGHLIRYEFGDDKEAFLREYDVTAEELETAQDINGSALKYNEYDESKGYF